MAIVTKRDVTESATNYAQGGIASVFSQEDSFDAHVQDTLVAGAGICHEDVVRLVVEEGPEVIRSLIDWGVHFTTSGDSYDLTREGGHSQRRILHADDVTGREIERALVQAARNNPNIKIYENHIGIDLITEAKVTRRRLKTNRCLGAHVLNSETNEVKTFRAKITLLATGGECQLPVLGPDQQLVLGVGDQGQADMRGFLGLDDVRVVAICDVNPAMFERVYAELDYRTLDTWSRSRRVVLRAEHSRLGDNPRFVVTSLDAAEVGDVGQIVQAAAGHISLIADVEQIPFESR